MTDYASIKRKLLITGHLFEDKDFPASNASLYLRTPWSTSLIEWKRPSVSSDSFLFSSPGSQLTKSGGFASMISGKAAAGAVFVDAGNISAAQSRVEFVELYTPHTNPHACCTHTHTHTYTRAHAPVRALLSKLQSLSHTPARTHTHVQAITHASVAA